MTTTDKVIDLVPLVLATDIVKKAGKGMEEEDEEKDGMITSAKNTRIV